MPTAPSHVATVPRLCKSRKINFRTSGRRKSTESGKGGDVVTGKPKETWATEKAGNPWTDFATLSLFCQFLFSCVLSCGKWLFHVSVIFVLLEILGSERACYFSVINLSCFCCLALLCFLLSFFATVWYDYAFQYSFHESVAALDCHPVGPHHLTGFSLPMPRQPLDSTALIQQPSRPWLHPTP